MKRRLLTSGVTILLLLWSGSPAVFAQRVWLPTNGPMGTDVKAIGFHSNGTLFAGTYPQGLFRSSDGGTSWEFVGFAGKEPRGIVEDASGNLLLATFSSGVFLSPDGGETWRTYNNGLSDPRVHSIAAHSRSGIIAGTHGAGAFEYVAGTGWQRHSEGLLDQDVRSVAFDSDGAAYAATFRAGVFRSTGGSPWVAVKGGSGINVIRSVVAERGLVAAGGWNGGIAYTRTTDTSWTTINTGLPNQKVWSLAITPAGEILAGMQANGLYTYDWDAGSWTHTGLDDDIISAINIRQSGETWVGARTGIYRAQQPGAMLELKGIPKSVAYAVRQTAAGALLVATEQNGAFRSEDAGANWTPSDLRVIDVLSLGILGSQVFAGSTFGKLYRSDDDGRTWIRIDRGPGDAWVAEPVSSIVVGDGTIYAGSVGDGVLKSDDGGESWQSAGLPDEGVLSMTAANNGTVWAGTFDGLFRTTDRGESWSSQNTGLASLFVRALFADRDVTLRAGTADGVYRLGPGTDSWEPDGLQGTTVTSITRGANGALYVGTYGSGVFERAGETSGWQERNEGLANLQVLSIEYASGILDGDALLASTDGDGVYVMLLPAVSVEEQPTFQPLIVLEQNYPNPLTASTTITFSLPTTADASLRIFDLLGREVATLVSGRLPSGHHTAEWESGGVAAGTYFYSLDVGGVRRTRPMMITR